MRKKSIRGAPTLVPPSTKPGNHLNMVLPDLHIPHYDPEALGVVLHTVEKLKPKRVIILGDWLDAEVFSRHPKKGLAEVVAHNFYRDEIEPCTRILDQLQQHCQELVYIEGNHEFRVERCAAESQLLSSLYDLISPRALLSANRQNFIWVPYSDAPHLSHYNVTPNLWAVHGFSHAKHAADVILTKLRSVSVVFGHIHRSQSTVSRNPVTNELIRVWSPGCLSQLQPLWRHNQPTDWCHGFSLIYVKDDLTEWTSYSPLIQRGECILPDGSRVVA